MQRPPGTGIPNWANNNDVVRLARTLPLYSGLQYNFLAHGICHIACTT